MMILAAAALMMQAADAPPPPALQAKIKRYFDADLFDGATARWKWTPMKRSAKGVYCGWVNSKNRVGAYVGWTPYYFFVGSDGKSYGDIFDADKKTAPIMFDTLCVQKGYDISSPPRD